MLCDKAPDRIVFLHQARVGVTGHGSRPRMAAILAPCQALRFCLSTNRVWTVTGRKRAANLSPPP